MQRFAQTLKTLRLGEVAIRRNPLLYAQARDQLRALERAPADERRQWNREQLAEVLWCARRTAYGRRVGGTRELAAWPLLDKESVRAQPDAFLSGAQLLTVKASTGGTSGAPLPLVRSLRSVAFEQACIDRMMILLGVEATRAKLAVLRADNVKDPSDFRPPYWTYAVGGRRMMMSSNHLNAATVGRYAEALEGFAPDVLWAYPTAVESLCVQLARAGRKLALGRVLTSSEMLHPEAWHFVARTLGCRLLDYYGQAERVAFAYAQTPGEYRFLPGYSHVELLPVGEDAGDTLCEIVGTSLWNRAMPLVRYRTGDLVRVPGAWGAAQLEEVALGLRPFAGVLGRDSEMLISPEGVRLTGINHLPRDVAHVVRIQVIQETVSEVRILVVPIERFSAADETQLRGNVAKKLPASMRVRIERVDSLERTRLGKTPFVIHRPAVKALLQGAVHGARP
jgi:phenylacetate-CoA ligase